MNKEELLLEMTKVRPELLNEDALELYNVIMCIIGERDDLKQRNDKAIEYIEKAYYEEYDTPLEHLCLKNCTHNPSLVALSILKGENNE